MAHIKARMLWSLAVVVLSLAGHAGAAPVANHPERVVFLAGDLTDEQLIAFTANFAASSHPGVALLDGPSCGLGNRKFLAAFQPEQVIPVGAFPDDAAGISRRLGVRVLAPLPWKHEPSRELWQLWFPRADQVVVCPAQPRRVLLQAAFLAGNLHAPLWVTADKRTPDELRNMLSAWHTQRVIAAGLPHSFGRDLGHIHVIHVPDEEAVAALALRHAQPRRPIQNLVVANPTETRTQLHGMSVLAPLLAVRHQAALLLTNDRGDDTCAAVREAIHNPRLRAADTVLLVGDLEAIPMERRANPLAGKDAVIELEPLTPTGNEPYSFAVGRLFHEDPGVVLLMQARQRLLQRASDQPRRALVASNAGNSLPLLEVFSRGTARELRNCGYQTTTLFGDDVTKDEVREQLPQQDIFLWEGHHSTLIRDYCFPDWTEPLPPALIFLQSCLALTDAKVHPALERGAVAVVGSSTRTFSASGGAFSLAYFNALLYDGQTLGGSLRRAKNFLLAYALLKENRLASGAKLAGANVRSSWAFTLWGDPTVKLPAPAPYAEGLPAVRHEVHGNTIIVRLPDVPPDKLRSANYQTELRPNTYLAGLIDKSGEDDTKKLVPFLFAEVALPKAPLGKVPRLSSRLPKSRYVFCWDQRRRCGYLLIMPRRHEQNELRFHVEWEVAGAEVNAATLQAKE